MSVYDLSVARITDMKKITWVVSLEWIMMDIIHKSYSLLISNQIYAPHKASRLVLHDPVVEI